MVRDWCGQGGKPIICNPLTYLDDLFHNLLDWHLNDFSHCVNVNVDLNGHLLYDTTGFNLLAHLEQYGGQAKFAGQ